MIFRMQANFMKSTRSTKAGYVDPMPIAQINFNYPSRWELDAPQLAAGGTLAEKEKIRAAKIREESLKVEAWIAVCLKNLQHFETIWIPYHFK